MEKKEWNFKQSEWTQNSTTLFTLRGDIASGSGTDSESRGSGSEFRRCGMAATFLLPLKNPIAGGFGNHRNPSKRGHTILVNSDLLIGDMATTITLVQNVKEELLQSQSGHGWDLSCDQAWCGSLRSWEGSVWDDPQEVQQQEQYQHNITQQQHLRQIAQQILFHPHQRPLYHHLSCLNLQGYVKVLMWLCLYHCKLNIVHNNAPPSSEKHTHTHTYYFYDCWSHGTLKSPK